MLPSWSSENISPTNKALLSPWFAKSLNHSTTHFWSPGIGFPGSTWSWWTPNEEGLISWLIDTCLFRDCHNSWLFISVQHILNKRQARNTIGTSKSINLLGSLHTVSFNAISWDSSTCWVHTPLSPVGSLTSRSYPLRRVRSLKISYRRIPVVIAMFMWSNKRMFPITRYD